jgi:two-component system phosphate regulon sensor histidine kinase PhoR
MTRRGLLWHLYPLYLVIAVIGFVVASLVAGHGLKHFYRQYAAEDLTSRGILAAEVLREHLGAESPEAFEARCREIGRRADIRLTVIMSDGSVVGDSQRDPLALENHATRPEVREALQGRIGRSERYSDSVRDRLMYVAVPILDDEGKVVAVVRTSISATLMDAALGGMQRNLAWIALAGGLVVFAVVAMILARINRPIDSLKRGAERFARGDLAFRIPVPAIEELAGLAESLNQMASQLSDRIETVVRQRNEQQAVFGSMVEGVIAIDEQEKVLQANAAAAELIGMSVATMQGRSLRELIRNPDLQRMCERALGSNESGEGEAIFYGARERSMQFHVTPLRDASGANIGALIVMNDVTNLRRLERVRRDFVANVSHELKTPLTSIKGFVETLLDGASEHPEEARRFLGILAKQVDRLHAILEDLLSLSRIEQENERNGMELSEGRIEDVLKAAIQVCAAHAEAKRIPVSLDIAGDPRALINAPLLEQAVVNLIDNAIKYSEPGRPLEIQVRRSDGDWAIRFIDQGCGIEAHHLGRIFERFYRVDKARSRKEGGTGLGLSIVKHIIAAHNGRAMAESTPGKGSVFTLFVPAAA